MKKNIYLVLGIFLIFGIYLIENVSAADGCCLRTITGEYFKFVDESYCRTEAGYFREGMKCEDVGDFLDDLGNSLFEMGCCIDYNNFECSNYVYRAMCADEGLNFESSSSETCSGISLNPNPCTLGCCVVNGAGYYETDMECDIRTNLPNEPDFRDLSENKCLLLSHSGDMGACVNSGTCTYGTRESCSTGEFYFNKYCSDPSLKPLGVSCIAHTHQSCSNNFGQIDVYWKDTCNNQEEIAIKCSESISKCGVMNNGTYGCLPTTCSYKGKAMKSGESKCIYESPAGNGTSFVGSVSGKVTCYNGKLDYKNCGDFEEGRTAICEELTTTDTGFTRAICIPNLVENCFNINSKYFEKINSEELTYESGMNKLESECNDTSGCFVKKATLADSNSFASFGSETNFEYEMCVPKDPLTIKVSDENTSCAMATLTCPVYFVKNAWGRYACRRNCRCLSPGSFVKMEDLCISMGDCGINVNIQGTLGKEGLSYEPSGDYGLDSKFIDETVGTYDAVINQRYINFAEKVIPEVEAIIKNLLLTRYNLFISQGQKPLKFQVPNEVMEEILGGEYNTLTAEEREQKIIEFYESQGKSLEELIVLNQKEWETYNPLDEWWSYLSIPSMVWNWIFGTGDVATIDVTYNCLDWQAPVGGDSCEKCSEGDFPCTAYECSSLGQACILINKDTDNPTCVSSIDDGKAPKVENMKSLKEGIYSITKTILYKNWSLSAIGIGGKCIPEDSQIEFELNLNELAQCRYSFDSYPIYDDMPGNYPTTNEYLMKHTFNVDAGRVIEHISDEKYEEYILCIEANETENYCITEAGITKADLSLKIRCSDIFGHFSNEVSLNYCIKTGPDEQAPQVRSFYPENGKEWEYNPGKFSLKIYLDEQANCRYDYNNKVKYEDFLYNMTLNGKIGNMGWVLSANMTENKQGKNQIFIACNDSSGNINKNILYEYTIKRDISQDEYIQNYGLKIDSIFMEESGINYPNKSNITTGKNPVLILKVQTSRGINDGISTCYLDENQRISMKNTDSSEHSQVYSGFSEGVKRLYVECDDGISSVNTSIRFNLTIDDEAPKIISNTTEGDYLVITTNEEAKCSYKNEDGNFNIDDGEFFYEVGYTLEHTVEWNPSKTYYIRCIDNYGNENLVGRIGEKVQGGPIITRISYVGEEITIKTNKKSICYYSTQKCDFDINETSAQMGFSLDLEHSLIMNAGDVYYIKCKDQYNTINPTCTAVQMLT